MTATEPTVTFVNIGTENTKLWSATHFVLRSHSLATPPSVGAAKHGVFREGTDDEASVSAFLFHLWSLYGLSSAHQTVLLWDSDDSSAFLSYVEKYFNVIAPLGSVVRTLPFAEWFAALNGVADACFTLVADLGFSGARLVPVVEGVAVHHAARYGMGLSEVARMAEVHGDAAAVDVYTERAAEEIANQLSWASNSGFARSAWRVLMCGGGCDREDVRNQLSHILLEAHPFLTILWS